jgi:cytochrome c-type biogenesis protein CcmH
MRLSWLGHSRKRSAAGAEENGHPPSRSRLLPSALVIVGAVAVLGAGLLLAASRSRPPQTMEQRVQEVASRLGCVTCQNLSVADSPAGTARAMRAEIRRRLKGGDGAAEITAFFVDKYGESILLSPRSPFPWVVPAVALGGGIVLVGWALWRRRPTPARNQVRLTASERARIRRDLAALEEPD